MYSIEHMLEKISAHVNGVANLRCFCMGEGMFYWSVQTVNDRDNFSQYFGDDPFEALNNTIDQLGVEL